MALIPLTYKLDWYNPSKPGGTISTINNNANTATSFDTQYSMQDIIDTVAATGGGISGAGVANNMAYWDGASSITYDSTTDFVYEPVGGGGQPDGRIGLGTSSPNFKMDISGGDLRFENNDGIRFGGTGSNNTNWRIFTTGTTTGEFSIGNNASTPFLTILRSGTQGQIRFDSYGSGTYTGTAAYTLEIDASGNIIESASSGPYVPYLSGTDQIARTEDFNFGDAVYGNTSLGFGALQSLSSSDAQYNVAMGYLAGTNITTGEKNVVIGGKAGDGMTTAEYNVVIGYEAGGFNTFDGVDNVLIGRNAGFAHQGGSDNVAVGDNSLNSATDANKNTAIGSNALASANPAGDSYNIAIGHSAGNAISTGTQNILLGADTDTLNNTDTNSIIIGYNVTGNGTNTITIGNTNNTKLILPGLQTTASDGDVLTYSTATGDIELQAPGGGGATDLNGLSDCLIDGTSSYLVNVPAGLSGNPVDNTVLGNGAGNALTTGANNTLIGSLVGDSITTGTKNVAIGDEALSSAGIAVGGIVAIGYQAGLSTASSNGVCIGYQSGKSNSGNGFIAVGYRSGYSNTSGSWNTTLGYFAAYTNTTGSENTTIGTEAGYNNTGTGNTFLGYQAGYTQTTGSNNTVIGHDAEPSAITVSDEITLGDANIATLRCAVNTITLISDERDKTDIQDIDYGLDLIEKLKPRKFTWNSRDGKKQGQKEVGFIAQELQQVDDEYLNFVLDNNPDKLEAGWMQLVPVLVKAIQELKEEIEELKRDRNV